MENQAVRSSKSDLLWKSILALSFLGLLDSIYLVWIKIVHTTPMCFGVGDCEAVNTSVYSEIHGIPIALFGAIAYTTLVALLLAESRWGILLEWGPLVEFGLALAGTLYSAYLTYIELEVIKKICPYCVTSAIAITTICILSAIRLSRQNSEG